MLEDACSTVVLMRTYRLSAFPNFQSEPLSDEDLVLPGHPLFRECFLVEKIIKGFKGAIRANGQRA